MTLHPSVAAVRVPVRAALSSLDPGDVVAIACSGGADSLALGSAAVFEGHKLGLRVVGVTVDPDLQPGSAEQADPRNQRSCAEAGTGSWAQRASARR